MTKEKKPKNPNHRMCIRFEPEVGAYAEIGHLDKDKNFVVDKVGIIVNESFSGCCIVLLDEEDFKEGHEFYVRINPLNYILAKIIWKKNLDDRSTKIGIEFLE